MASHTDENNPRKRLGAAADWKCARLLTDRLAEFDPADPVRYDFAICRLGILDRCSGKRKKELCDVCLLNDVCRFPVTT